MADEIAAAPEAPPAPPEVPAAAEPAPGVAGAVPEVAPAPPAVGEEKAPEPSPAPASEAVPDGAASLLGGEAQKPAEEAKPEAAPPEEEAPAPAYEPFALPEGLTPEPERMAELTGILGELRASQEQGQKLVDLYVAEAGRYRDFLASEQRRVFDETRAGWRRAATDDPEFGGARLSATLSSIRSMRDRFAADDAHLREFARVLDFTGAGDHPAVIRWFAAAAREFERLAREPGPVPAQRAAVAVNRYQRRYLNTVG